jgi:hypothetical protein
MKGSLYDMDQLYKALNSNNLQSKFLEYVQVV